MRSVHVTGERLGLREVTVDDVDALHAVYGDPAATHHLPFDPRTREEVAEIVAEAITAAAATLAACTCWPSPTARRAR
ncbi:GNAT family N-acetyltransferase [Nonomuraea recticatena]|uniref:GNAT family N-acetyltransferase n=1 Tax=Nonomuraea recticatena TaxID=46178 RepID=UPI003621C323